MPENNHHEYLKIDSRLTANVQTDLTWVEINRNALESNLEKIKMLTLPSAEILAVIKSNGYGHGLLEIARILEKKVAYFGVASVEEALKLRQFEISTPILLFGIHFSPDIERAIQAEITLSISSLDQAFSIEETAARLEKPALIHIKVDTGMGRLGIPIGNAKSIVQKIYQMPHIKLEGIYTHFPVAEEFQNQMTEKQIKEFHSLLSYLSERQISFAYRHAANSAGIFHHKASHFNLVRPGLSIYGIYSDESIRTKVSLSPVLSWKARIILVKQISKGESVGYGRTFTAEEKTNLAVLPIGYSHGYPFSLSAKSRVLIEGKSYPIAGRVSMDYLVVNLGKDEAKIGDIAILLGGDGPETIRAEELGKLAGTIPYEIVTRINREIPRIVV